MPYETSNEGLARDARRAPTSVAVTSVGSTGIYTVPAGFLRELARGSVVRFSGLTGGSGVVAGQVYYISAVLSSTTFTIAALYGGPPITGGSNITSGTASNGSLVTSGAGNSGNIVHERSDAGRSSLYPNLSA